MVEVVQRDTQQRGVDVILDHLGGAYLAQNVRALAVGGRLAVIGVMGGRKAELDVGRVLANRLSILGSVLRPRPAAEKAAIIGSFEREVMPHFAAGRIVPLIHRVYPLEEAADVPGVVSRHLGELLTRFAASVDEGEREAQAAADSLVRDARTEAAALFESARTSYEAHVTARRSAMSQLEGALGQMTDALAALASVPDFPPIPASVAVAKVDDALEHLQADLVA